MTHYAEKAEWLCAARIQWALVAVKYPAAFDGTAAPDETVALEFLKKCDYAGMAKDNELQQEAEQLETDILVSRGFRDLYAGIDTTQLVARVKELLASNPTLRTEKIGLAMTLYSAQWTYFWGAFPSVYEIEGFEVTRDSIFAGYEIIRNHWIPGFHEGAGQSVGARIAPPE